MSNSQLPHFNSQNDQILFEEILPFYEDAKNRKIIMPIIQGKSKVSLRVIDHFVTNYALKNNIQYTFNNEEIYVHPDYKAKLKPYSKKRFDPFCRGGKKEKEEKKEKEDDKTETEVDLNYMDGSTRQKFKFPMEENSGIITRLCQLNFFKWAIKNGILHYTLKHLDEIEKDMNRNSNKRKKKTTIKKENEKGKGKEKKENKGEKRKYRSSTNNVTKKKKNNNENAILDNAIKIRAKSQVNKYTAHIFVQLD